MPQTKDNKEIYTKYADHIHDKRFASKNALRRYAHISQYQSVIRQIYKGEMVLDAGCGDGVLSCLLAKEGIEVTGVDISAPNIEAAKKLAKDWGVEDKTNFMVGDAENLAFPDNSFDAVVSSHVLEHLPDFHKGLREVYRVTKKKAVIALPSALNLCSMIQVGHGSFWEKSKRSLLAIPWGFFKILFGIFGEGANEGYVGNKDLIHIFRYPWVMKRHFRKVGFKLEHFEASTICLPFFVSLLPFVKFLDKMRAWSIMRNFGYGSTAVLKK